MASILGAFLEIGCKETTGKRHAALHSSLKVIPPIRNRLYLCKLGIFLPIALLVVDIPENMPHILIAGHKWRGGSLGRHESH
jgi:hypothetical protein